MDAFLKTLQTLPEASELIARVENGGCPAVLTGTAPVQRACIGAAVGNSKFLYLTCVSKNIFLLINQFL